jgi:prevent-host-death family protein
MPKTRPSSDLRNKYNEISEICHLDQEPVFITRNGKADLVVMSIEVFEQMVEKFELYYKIDKGMDDIENGRIKPAREVFEQKRQVMKTASGIIDRNIDAFKELKK